GERCSPHSALILALCTSSVISVVIWIVLVLAHLIRWMIINFIILRNADMLATFAWMVVTTALLAAFMWGM
ncbi:hypothetical protein ACYBWZ_22530, partial [Klebsiella pneumoniae]